MPEASNVVFDRGLDFLDAVVTELQADDWDKPSPCQGWTALDVLGHVGSSIDMGISLLRGEQPTWPEFDRPGELVDEAPIDYWRRRATMARAALDGAPLDMEMDTPMGKRTVADRLAFPAIDLYVHAWDIGQAAHIEVEVPDFVVEFAHSYIDPIPDEMVRGPKGAFGAEVEVGADATPTQAFMAWTGRDPR